MKKLSIQDVKKLSKLEMKKITAGSGNGGGGGGGGTGGGGGNNGNCGNYCLPQYSGYCVSVCTYCYVAPGTTSGVCQA